MNARHSISSGSIVIEADTHCPAATVQVSHLDLVERERHVLSPTNAYRVDLCVTPRLPSSMRFDRWAPHRFERPGRIFVVPPGETLAVWNDLGRETVIVAHLFTDAMARWLEDDCAPQGDPLDNSLDIASGRIEQVMLLLREEARNPGLAAGVMLEGLALQLAVELQRHYRSPPSPAPAGGLAPWRLRRIEQRLRSTDDPPSLVELASLCSLSVRHLARGFQASKGQSLGHYVTHHRIERAKQKLASDPSVKAVAASLGFSSTAAFSAAFRKATGLTPSEFRRLAC